MEIHPPHGAIHSVKDFLIHLLAITIGLLLALTLESTVEWIHHRRLAHEAEANLRTEIADNQREIAQVLQELPGSQKRLETIVSAMRQFEVKRNTPIHNLSYSYVLHTLSVTSWNTTNSTGAISYMEYAKAKQYTEVYGDQQMFLSMQERLVGSFEPLGVLPVMMDRDPKRITDVQLLEIERAASVALVNVQALENLAKDLNENYAQVLSRK
jgi:hypothetical protein